MVFLLKTGKIGFNLTLLIFLESFISNFFFLAFFSEVVNEKSLKAINKKSIEIPKVPSLFTKNKSVGNSKSEFF